MAEDDILQRLYNTAVLSRSGYEVDSAADGEAAWQALTTDRYDLLLTDNNMPKVSGLELLRKLRAAGMDLPVIMATGTLPQEVLTGHPWLQPAATLLKPYTSEEMLKTVEKVLRKADEAAVRSQQSMEPDTACATIG